MLPLLMLPMLMLPLLRVRQLSLPLRSQLKVLRLRNLQRSQPKARQHLLPKRRRLRREENSRQQRRMQHLQLPLSSYNHISECLIASYRLAEARILSMLKSVLIIHNMLICDLRVTFYICYFMHMLLMSIYI